MQSRLAIALLILVAILALLIGFSILRQTIVKNDINSFEDCAASGRPVLETFPEQCIGPDGTRYTKQYDTTPRSSI